MADTKNVGIKYSKGKYLSFIDSDDYIDKNFYADSIKYIIEKNVDVIIYDWETIDIVNNTKYIVAAKNDKYNNDKWGCIDVSIMPSSCNKIVKKNLFEGLEFPVGLRYEDLGTTLIVLLKAKNIKYINKPYYKYCLTPNSIMRIKFDERNLQIIDIFNILNERLENLKISKFEKDCCLYMIYTRRLYEFLLENIAKEPFFRKYKILKSLCNKIQMINIKMNKNVYYKKCISKKKLNKLLQFFINHKCVLLLTLSLNKRIYYKFFHVKYLDCISLESNLNLKGE